MKKLIIAIVFSSFAIVMHAQTGPPPCDDFVTLRGKQFYCGYEPFYVLACTYSFSAYYSYPWTGKYGDIYLARNFGYGPADYTDSCYGHCDVDTCGELACYYEIRNDLDVMHSMGFNSFRITFGLEYDTSYSKDTLVLSCYGCIWDSVSRKMFITSSTNDSGRIRLFQIIDTILQLGNQCGLKVLLDAGYGMTTIDSVFPYYLDFLEKLARHITNLDIEKQRTLLCYNILEEPSIEQPAFTKSVICQKINDMYDAIRTYDSVHLISVGGRDVTDILMWDPGVMKLDFYTPHFYVMAQDSLGETNSDQAVERMKGDLYWFKNNCPLPWMVGECGFSATDDELGWVNDTIPYYPYAWPCGALSYPYINGELLTPKDTEIYTQTSFADTILKMVRDCGGSGFTWWDFQEGWGNPGKKISDNTDYMPYISGNCFGLLRYGEAKDSISIKWNGDTVTIFKPVVDSVFRRYLDDDGQPPPVDPNGGQMPTHYNDPYYTVCIYQTTLSGTVKDTANNPLKDVLIRALTVGDPDWGIPYFIYDFSDDSGYFNFKSPFNPNDDDKYINLEVSYYGASLFKRDNYPPSNPWNISCTLNLNGQPVMNNVITTNQSIVNGAHEYSGWNSLTTSGTWIITGGQVDFHAQNMVHVQSEFEVSDSGEVHVFCAPYYINCIFFIDSTKCLIVENPTHENSEKEIELGFAKPQEWSFSVFPNPCNDHFTLYIDNNNTPDYNSMITDILGNIIFEHRINSLTYVFDLSDYGPGIYFIKIYNENNIKTKMIINQ